MKAGNLFLWFTHYKRASGQDELGAPSPTFVNAGAYNCGVLPINANAAGLEMFNAGHMLIRIDRQFETRYGGVRAEDRIEVDGIMYDVLTVVDPKGDGSAFHMKCKNSD
jgi:SPP1 family predicted phage head-tail adaptor